MSTLIHDTLSRWAPCLHLCFSSMHTGSSREPCPLRLRSAGDSSQNFPGPMCAPWARNSEASYLVGTKHHSSELGSVIHSHKFKCWLRSELLEASHSICIFLSGLSGGSQASTWVKDSVRGKPPGALMCTLHRVVRGQTLRHSQLCHNAQAPASL